MKETILDVLMFMFQSYVDDNENNFTIQTKKLGLVAQFYHQNVLNRGRSKNLIGGKSWNRRWSNNV